MTTTKQTPLSDLVARLGISAHAEERTANPNLNPTADGCWSRDASHWFVSLRRPADPQTFAVYFSMGSAAEGPPSAEMVLESLILDAASMDADQTFGEWADETDVQAGQIQAAEETFKAIEANTASLRLFLGDDFETALDLARDGEL